MAHCCLCDIGLGKGYIDEKRYEIKGRRYCHVCYLAVKKGLRQPDTTSRKLKDCQPDTTSRKLKDCEPGCTREEFLDFLRKVTRRIS